MDRNYIQDEIKKFRLINFNHLMSIYELNFYNFNCLFSRINEESICVLDKRKLVINDIHHDKHTRIFKLFHKFEFGNQTESINMFSIKPHTIFYMYKDAKLLEVKSLSENRQFETTFKNKFKINLRFFYWLKSYINQ